MSNTRPKRPFPIVGLGASAGGLSAFEEFFSALPTDGNPEMAFILVQHLAPDHESILDQLIRRHTEMQVHEIQDGVVVQPNCAYIIPPGQDLTLEDGVLHLSKPAEPRGHRLPIDSFFASLAKSYGAQAIAIILSGSGQDGSEGIRAIKAAGGLVMVQEPSTAQFDSMPQSAIDTGLVDYQLKPADMPEQLLAYVASGFRSTPPEGGPSDKDSLKKILDLLCKQTLHDFNQYKPSTILRRLDRRMLFHRIDNLESYAELLKSQPEEIDKLFQEMLIGVTSLFRDPDAFAILEEQLLPRIFANRPTSSAIRCWSAGCSTGEEAYSLAILLRESMDELKQSYPVQIFATDIDPQAIATARAGIYPKSIVLELSPERLARFFTLEADGNCYRVHKSIRDMLIFSEQDLIKDAPFSKLDLILCRNVMIYMGRELHKRLLPLFHYALKPGGLLLLGNSESVGDFGDLFAPIDRKAKLYQRQEDLPGKQHQSDCQFLSPTTPHRGRKPDKVKSPTPAQKSLQEITEHALLTLVAPPSALVNAQGDVLYLHGRAGRYLEPADGETRPLNLFRVARESLRWELMTAIRRAAELGEVVYRPDIRLESSQADNLLELRVYPMPLYTKETPLFLVVLHEQPPASKSEAGKPASDAEESDVLALKRELRMKEDYLQLANQELEVSNDELKSANEEMQSMNEELQSSNEELETSKEELQSVNEELTTVNAELQTKVAFLSRAHSDLNNLLAGTGIATMFVDQELRILRFTPATSAIINLIPSDVGRPMGHIVSNLIGEERLEADAQSVLATLQPLDAEVVTKSGTTYRMLVQPYRTLENLVEGVVFTFMDISDSKRLASVLQQTSQTGAKIDE